MFSRKVLFALMVVIFALGASAPSLAGKGGGSATPSASITLNQPLAAASTLSAWPALGSTVDFSTSYPKNTKNPRIEVRCYDASGSMVYAAAGAANYVFLLGGASSVWMTNGGSATCTARLFDLIWSGNNPQEVVWLASTSFDAAG